MRHCCAHRENPDLCKNKKWEESKAENKVRSPSVSQFLYASLTKWCSHQMVCPLSPFPPQGSGLDCGFDLAPFDPGFRGPQACTPQPRALNAASAHGISDRHAESRPCSATSPILGLHSPQPATHLRVPVGIDIISIGTLPFMQLSCISFMFSARCMSSAMLLHRDLCTVSCTVKPPDTLEESSCVFQDDLLLGLTARAVTLKPLFTLGKRNAIVVD